MSVTRNDAKHKQSKGTLLTVEALVVFQQIIVFIMENVLLNF